MGSGTLAGASEIYFMTLNTATCATSGTNGMCGVQDSQTTLNFDWSEFRLTPDGDAWNQYETALSPSTAHDLEKTWSYTTDNEVVSSPTVANGVVYVGSFDDNIYALGMP